jgi:hypothetical protein
MIVRFDDIVRFADPHCSNFHSKKNNNKHFSNLSRTKDRLK